MVDLTAVLTPEQGRSIESITSDILEAKRVGGEAILTIGRCLTEAKQVLPHGEWLPWLNEKVEFSERTANRFMRLSREWSNPTALSDLGATKALALLALPAEERDAFMEENNVVDMSSRELEQAIRERDEAKKQVEQLEDALQKQKIQSEVDISSAELFGQRARDDADHYQKMVKDLEEKERQLTRELEDLKAAPVEVAVMQVDQEALDKARAEGRAEVQDKLDKAKEQKAKAEEKRKAAEESLAALREQLAAAQKAAKEAAITGDKDMATFDVLFLQSQEQVNKMRGILLKLRGRDDQSSAGTVQKAMRALGEAIGRAAE